ncbi:MAG: hypothetical protein IT484_08190 [Gammaproteobacteria bacterium]|nr:hypothetical protein [Gammaproteobacteria bacterium]
MRTAGRVTYGKRRRLHALAGTLGAFLLQSLWLPAGAYAAVPWIYLGTGSAALLGGLYLPEDDWYLPYLALGGVGLLRTAVGIAAMRQRRQARRRSRHPA